METTFRIESGFIMLNLGFNMIEDDGLLLLSKGFWKELSEIYLGKNG